MSQSRHSPLLLVVSHACLLVPAERMRLAVCLPPAHGVVQRGIFQGYKRSQRGIEPATSSLSPSDSWWIANPQDQGVSWCYVNSTHCRVQTAGNSSTTSWVQEVQYPTPCHGRTKEATQSCRQQSHLRCCFSQYLFIGPTLALCPVANSKAAAYGPGPKANCPSDAL